MSAKFSEPAPISPGEVLRDNVLAGTGITQDALAIAMGVSRFSVNQIINDRRSVTAEMALRLARVLDTTPDFWLSLQCQVDLYRARRRAGEEIRELPVLKPAKTDVQRFRSLEEITAGS